MPKLLNKVNLPRYSSAPATPSEADLYYNTSDDKIYYYTGSAWQEVGSGAGGNLVYYQTTAPGTANAGDIWIDSDDDLIPGTQLTDSVSSTSTSTAATPNSVKTAYDLANAAIPKNTVTTAGDILYASGSATIVRLGIGTATQVLQVGTAGIPEWGQPVATIGTADTSGTYGVTTLTDSVSSTATTSAAVPNAVKTSYDFAATKAKVSVGTAEPSTPSTGDVWINTAGTASTTNAVPLSTFTTSGDMLYATGAGTATRLAIGTANQILSVSAGLPSWSTLATASTGAYGITQLTDSTSSTSTMTSATPNSVKTAYDTAATAIPKNTATTAGDILYASGSATITRLGIGSTDQVLVVASGAPSWAYKPNVAVNAQSGTAYTLALTDAGKMVEMSNASAITLTVPTNGSAAFPVGTQIDLLQTGAGTVTVGGAGVTLQSNGSKLKLNGQYAAATLIKRATDTWVLIGNLTT